MMTIKRVSLERSSTVRQTLPDGFVNGIDP
jgi:hypothetical protein